MLARNLPVDNSIVISSHSPGTRKEILCKVTGRRENSGRTQNDGKRQKKSNVPKLLRSVIAALLPRHLPRYYCLRYYRHISALLLRFYRGITALSALFR